MLSFFLALEFSTGLLTPGLARVKTVAFPFLEALHSLKAASFYIILALIADDPVVELVKPTD